LIEKEPSFWRKHVHRRFELADKVEHQTESEQPTKQGTTLGMKGSIYVGIDVAKTRATLSLRPRLF
jgi:hypothetical protein